MVPHTIVCAPGLVIYKIYNGYWFFGRPTVEELRMDLRAVLQQCHWDWDLSDPQVRAAWNFGQTDRFYPPELGWPQDRTTSPPPQLQRSADRRRPGTARKESS
jgi:hypothetical protein